jgi:non-heme chloroperoxidase
MRDTQRHYVEIEPGVDLYVEETGAGRPLVFIPGWTMTTEVFARQVARFAADYRVITYDPRCQGRSSKTLHGVNYAQHGRDLGLLIDRLGLEDAVLAPWSYGCLKVWELFRRRGTDGIAGVVWIDLSPQQIERRQGDWAEGDIDFLTGFQRAMADDYRATTRAFCDAMWQGEAPADELDWVAEQSMKTPQYAALLMTADGMTRDATDLAEQTDGALPMLHIVHETKGKAARAYCARHCPAAEVVPLGYHFMFWEHAARFNDTVAAFLKEHGL